jgi:hypothetical protein
LIGTSRKWECVNVVVIFVVVIGLFRTIKVFLHLCLRRRVVRFGLVTHFSLVLLLLLERALWWGGFGQGLVVVV